MSQYIRNEDRIPQPRSSEEKVTKLNPTKRWIKADVLTERPRQRRPHRHTNPIGNRIREQPKPIIIRPQNSVPQSQIPTQPEPAYAKDDISGEVPCAQRSIEMIDRSQVIIISRRAAILWAIFLVIPALIVLGLFIGLLVQQ